MNSEVTTSTGSRRRYRKSSPIFPKEGAAETKSTKRQVMRRSLGLINEEEEETKVTESARFQASRLSDTATRALGRRVTYSKPTIDRSGIKTFKVILIGDRRVGKTSFCRMSESAGCTFSFTYPVTTYEFETSGVSPWKKIRFSVWDSSVPQFGGGATPDPNFFEGADALFFMFDLKSRVTLKSGALWCKEARRMVGTEYIPTVYIGNKCEGRNMYKRSVGLHVKDCEYGYVDISVRAAFNVFAPFLWLTRELAGDLEIEFLTEPTLREPEANMEPNFARRSLAAQEPRRRNENENMDYE